MCDEYSAVIQFLCKMLITFTVTDSWFMIVLKSTFCVLSVNLAVLGCIDYMLSPSAKSRILHVLEFCTAISCLVKLPTQQCP